MLKNMVIGFLIGLSPCVLILFRELLDMRANKRHKAEMLSKIREVFRNY